MIRKTLDFFILPKESETAKIVMVSFESASRPNRSKQDWDDFKERFEEGRGLEGGAQNRRGIERSCTQVEKAKKLETSMLDCEGSIGLKGPTGNEEDMEAAKRYTS